MSDIEVIDLSDDDDEVDESTKHPSSEPTSVPKLNDPAVPSCSKSLSSGLQQNGDHPSETKNEAAFKMLKKTISTVCLEDSPAVISKIDKKFKECSEEFRVSEDCYDLLSKLHTIINKDNKHVWVHLKTFYDDLKKYRKKQKQVETAEDNEASEVNSEADKVKRKTEAHLKKLYKTFHQCQKEIKRLDEEEVNWEDENNSAFMKKRKYEERAVVLFKKMQEYEKKLTNDEVEPITIRHPKICTLGVAELEHKHINAAVDKFVNRQLKSGDICFPNFREIKAIVSRVNNEENLKLSPDDVSKYAQTSFQIVGKKIKMCREMEFQKNVLSLVAEEQEDPADNDPELKKRLDENRKLSEMRMSEVLDKFTKESEKKEKEENLGTDDEQAQDNDNLDVSDNELEDEEDYETQSVAEDEDPNKENDKPDDKLPSSSSGVESGATDNSNSRNVSPCTEFSEPASEIEESRPEKMATVEAPTQPKETVPKKGKCPNDLVPGTAKSVKLCNAPDQAVPSGSPVKSKNLKRKFTKEEQDLVNEIEQWSDIECTLTNSDSEEERALLKSDDDFCIAMGADDDCCENPCPLKKSRLEESEEDCSNGHASLNDAEKSGADSGSFNPIIVGVESQVSGFSPDDDCNLQDTEEFSHQPPSEDLKSIAFNLSEVKEESKCSPEKTIVPDFGRVRQKARKSFPKPRSPTYEENDCITLD